MECIHCVNYSGYGCYLSDPEDCKFVPTKACMGSAWYKWMTGGKMEEKSLGVPDGKKSAEEKIMRIKTVRNRLDNVERFDEEVNRALADGWKMVKRYVVPSYEETSYIMLVAELEREDENS